MARTEYRVQSTEYRVARVVTEYLEHRTSEDRPLAPDREAVVHGEERGAALHLDRSGC